MEDADNYLIRKIGELKRSIVTKGIGQFTTSNLEKIRQLEALTAKLNNEWKRSKEYARRNDCQSGIY